MDIQIMFNIICISLIITLFFSVLHLNDNIKKLEKHGVEKQGPPGPKGYRGAPCDCKKLNDKEKTLLTQLVDEENNILWESNGANHKPWADYIEEEE